MGKHRHAVDSARECRENAYARHDCQHGLRARANTGGGHRLVTDAAEVTAQRGVASTTLYTTLVALTGGAGANSEYRGRLGHGRLRPE